MGFLSSFFNKKASIHDDIVTDVQKHGIAGMKNRTSEELRKLEEWSYDVAGAYGFVLENNTSIYKSIEILPFPVNTIATSLLTAIAFCILKSNSKELEILESSYLLLGYFIDLPKERLDKIVLINPDIMQKNMNSHEVTAGAQQIVDQSDEYDLVVELGKKQQEWLKDFRNNFFGQTTP